jgi:hypothetical protein
MAKKRKARKQKEHKKRTLNHVIEAEAERIAGRANKEDVHKIIPNDIISDKAKEYQKAHELNIKSINHDAIKSVVFGVVFVAIIAGIYFYDQSTSSLEGLSRDLLSFVLS